PAAGRTRHRPAEPAQQLIDRISKFSSESPQEQSTVEMLTPRPQAGNVAITQWLPSPVQKTARPSGGIRLPGQSQQGGNEPEQQKPLGYSLAGVSWVQGLDPNQYVITWM